MFPQFGGRTPRGSILPSEAFKGISVLKVPADVRLPPHVYGRDTIPEALFSGKGDYTIMMGENLESDHAAPPFTCTVTFIP